MPVRGDWPGRLQKARELYRERFEDGLPLRTMSRKVEGRVEEGTPTSYATLQRYFNDPGYTPDGGPNVELLRGLADVLAVREEWLLEGEGEPTREAQRRELRSADAVRRFRESVSEPFELPDAAEALLEEAMRRWAELPDYMFEGGGAPEPEEALDELVEIMRLVLKRLPRKRWSDRDWHDFSVALLGALMVGIKGDLTGAHKRVVLGNLEGFVSVELEEAKVSRREG